MTWTTVYLGVNAVMYAGFAVWCALRPRSTARWLGFDLLNWHGVSEYVAVYGGLEAGLAAFYTMALFQERLRGPALLMSLCLYAGIALFRTAVLVRSGFAIGPAAYFLVTEYALAVAAGWLYLRGRPPA